MADQKERQILPIIPLIVLGLLYVCSILFFHYVEGWSYLDAAYFTTVTIVTVGYGDFTPKTNLGKIGVIVLIFTGVSLALYVISHLGVLREKTIDSKVRDRVNILKNLAYLHGSDPADEEIKRKLKKKMNNENLKDSEGR